MSDPEDGASDEGTSEASDPDVDDRASARQEALAMLESVQAVLLAELQERIGPSLPDYDAVRVGTLHGWFVNRGGEADNALRRNLSGTGADGAPSIEARAEQYGVPPEILGRYEDAARRRSVGPRPRVRAMIQTAAAERSTRYTNPWWFARLEQLARALFAARDAHFRNPHPLAVERPRRDDIVLGTLPGVNVQAEVMPAVRGRCRIIVVDETLFIFSFLLGQILVAATVPNGDERWNLDRDRRARHLSENPWIGEQATALFRAYALEGHLRGVRPLKLEVAHEPGLAVSVTATQLFVIGHELAHCFQSLGNAWRPPPGMEDLSPKHQREIDADITGLQLAIQTGLDQGWEPEIVVREALLFLLGMAKLDAAVSILSGNTKDMWAATKTHPSFMTRCLVILGGIEQLVPPERVALTRQYIQQSDALLQDVLAPMQEVVRRDAASGLRAHPIWKEH